jgi:hypothetical protein
VDFIKCFVFIQYCYQHVLLLVYFYKMAVSPDSATTYRMYLVDFPFFAALVDHGLFDKTACLEWQVRDSCGISGTGETPQAQAPRRLSARPTESEHPEMESKPPI